MTAPRRRGRGGRPLPKGWRSTIRPRILRRDRHRCQLGYNGCTITASHVDHIVPASQGGSDHDANLQAACPHCHDRKTAREAVAARAARPGRLRQPEPHPGLNR